MQLNYKYLQKYYHKIAEEQLADAYRDKGYQVSTECRLEGSTFIADLLVEKGAEKIVIEIKTRRMDAADSKRLSELADYVKSLGGYRFMVAVVTPPKNREIVIEGLEEALLCEMNNDVPDDIDALATHSRIEDISDIDVQTITVEGNEIYCTGTGIIDVELQYGSDGDLNRDNGYRTSDSLAFTFDVSLVVNSKGISDVKINQIDVDTSRY